MIDKQNRVSRLLIIDDEEEMLNSLRRLFRKEYEVFIAKSADEGYKIMLENEIHVILSDQRMPGLSGSEFFDKIKRIFPDSVRLILTGYADLDAVIEAVNRGNIFRYITKPWNPLELKTIIKEAFERHWLVIDNTQLLKDLKTANEVLEEKVLERTKDLNEKNRMMNHFLGMAAHDLRNPLANISMVTDLLMEDKDNLSEKNYNFLNHISELSSFMINLISDMLDVSVIENGTINLNLLEHDFKEQAEYVINLYKFIADKKNIKINLVAEKGKYFCIYDKEKIGQVMSNFISNAVKYSPGKSEIIVDIKQNEDSFIFSVFDKGPGIKDAEQQTLFAPFKKASSVPTAEEKSTGLGLYIAKRLIEQHNGQIGINSNYGSGSQFYFLLPKNQ